SVREQSQHDVLVVGVDRSVDLPLVRAEPEPVGREQLGGRPDVVVARDLEVKVSARVDGDVVRVTLADARHATAGHLPGVPLPGERRRARGGSGPDGAGHDPDRQGATRTRHGPTVPRRAPGLYSISSRSFALTTTWLPPASSTS